MGTSVRVRLVPSVPERGERRLVAPRLDHDDADRDPLTVAALDLREHACLRVPLIGAHPGREHPVGRELRPAGPLEERREDGVRVARVEIDAELRLPVELGLDPDAVAISAADVEPDAPRRRDVEAPAAGDDRERHRQVRAGALLLVLLEHDRIRRAPALVERVEALAEADDALPGFEPEGEAEPVAEPAVAEPLDARSGGRHLSARRYA